MRYAIRGTDSILPTDLNSPSASVRDITQRFTKALEDLIRNDVTQYFWLHRRWKHQPPQKQRRAA